MADSCNGFSMEPFKTLRKSLPKTTRFVGAAHDGGLNSDVHSIGKGGLKVERSWPVIRLPNQIRESCALASHIFSQPER